VKRTWGLLGGRVLSHLHRWTSLLTEQKRAKGETKRKSQKKKTPKAQILHESEKAIAGWVRIPSTDLQSAAENLGRVKGRGDASLRGKTHSVILGGPEDRVKRGVGQKKRSQVSNRSTATTRGEEEHFCFPLYSGAVQARRDHHPLPGEDACVGSEGRTSNLGLVYRHF